MKDKFCSYCGTEFTRLDWPRQCAHCAKKTYQNPQPVIVIMVPIISTRGIGMLLSRRAIPPVSGLEMPGGFMNCGESWQDSASRELYEETNIRIPAKEFILFDVVTSTDNGQLLLFALAKFEIESVLEKFVPNKEVSEVIVAYPKDGQKLCWGAEQHILDKWFKMLERT